MSRLLVSSILFFALACGGQKKTETKAPAAKPESARVAPSPIRPPAGQKAEPESDGSVHWSMDGLKFSIILPDETWEVKEDTDPDSPVMFGITQSDLGVTILHLGEQSDSPKDVVEGFRKPLVDLGYKAGPIVESGSLVKMPLEVTNDAGNVLRGYVYGHMHPAIPHTVMVWIAGWPVAHAETLEKVVETVIGTIRPLQ